MVLGDRSKRAAAKRAGIDRQRLEAMRSVRQRTAAEEPRRFNHYDDGAGSWVRVLGRSGLRLATALTAYYNPG